MAGDELARTVQDIEREEEAQTSAKAAMKSRLATLATSQSELAEKVATRSEERDVDVDIQLTDKNIIQEVRRDTGEVILERLPKPEEQQKKF